MDWFAAANGAASSYLGIATDPAQMQMAEYIRRQGDPRNVPMAERIPLGAQNAWRPANRRPTMTLAEYDARREAFRASNSR